MDTAIFDTGFEDTGQDPIESIESEDTPTEVYDSHQSYEVVSAAELAGEKGGEVSCSIIPFPVLISTIALSLVICFFRRTK